MFNEVLTRITKENNNDRRKKINKKKIELS